MAGKGLNCMSGDTPDFSELVSSDVAEVEGEMPSLGDLLGVASSVVDGDGSSLSATWLVAFSLEDLLCLVCDEDWPPFEGFLTAFFGEEATW